jgi:hypothetical protein
LDGFLAISTSLIGDCFKPTAGARFDEVVTIEQPVALWLPMAAIEQANRNLL